MCVYWFSEAGIVINGGLIGWCVLAGDGLIGLQVISLLTLGELTPSNYHS